MTADELRKWRKYLIRYRYLMLRSKPCRELDKLQDLYEEMKQYIDEIEAE